MTREKSDYIIRLAQDKDLPMIEQIWCDGLKQLYPFITIDEVILDRFRNNFNNRQHHFNFWVAQASDVIGWCSILPAFSHPLKQKSHAEVSTYVDSNTKERGIGTTLMLHVFDAIKTTEIESVFGFAQPQNSKSIKMCETAGMTICGQTSTKIILLKEFK